MKKELQGGAGLLLLGRQRRPERDRPLVPAEGPAASGLGLGGAFSAASSLPGRSAMRACRLPLSPSRSSSSSCPPARRRGSSPTRRAAAAAVEVCRAQGKTGTKKKKPGLEVEAEDPNALQSFHVNCGTSSNSGRGVHEDNLNKEELLWEGGRWWSTMSKDETLLLQAGRWRFQIDRGSRNGKGIH